MGSSFNNPSSRVFEFTLSYLEDAHLLLNTPYSDIFTLDKPAQAPKSKGLFSKSEEELEQDRLNKEEEQVITAPSQSYYHSLQRSFIKYTVSISIFDDI